ncbi:MAG: Fic family protein [Alistipes sp.]|nr:Fic family protein [Alistipes sp.]MBR6550637.1 Fic family protein [Paludibacteraceae bacterium]
MNEFDQYIRQGEPSQQERAAYWRTAIGLQAVDGLQTSDYLKATAIKHIEGEIDIDQARQLIKTYYQSKTTRETIDDDQQEADKVSANITKILSSVSLDFSAKGFVALHRRIFDGVLKHAGEIRHYDITKKEWVLDSDTVNYLNWEDLYRALDFDIEQERQFSYKHLSLEQQVLHISHFVSGLWQIHPFGEGNTRTTAVFTILYLRHIGFKVENDLFANNSWYFRNALVRANYKNAVKGIDYSPVYLERFFRNLLMGEQWDLRNRYLHISPSPEWQVQPQLGVEKRVVTTEKTTESIAENIVENIVENLSAMRGSIVKIIWKNPRATAQSISKEVGIAPRNVQEHLKYLQKAGILRRVGPDKGGHWEVLG